MSAYKRVLLKLSGESLGGPAGKGIDENWLAAYAEEIASAVKNGLQVSIVIGGGNIFRGLQGVGKGFDRVNGDKMGMLATVKDNLFNTSVSNSPCSSDFCLRIVRRSWPASTNALTCE